MIDGVRFAPGTKWETVHARFTIGPDGASPLPEGMQGAAPAETDACATAFVAVSSELERDWVESLPGAGREQRARNRANSRSSFASGIGTRCVRPRRAGGGCTHDTGNLFAGAVASPRSGKSALPCLRNIERDTKAFLPPGLRRLSAQASTSILTPVSFREMVPMTRRVAGERRLRSIAGPCRRAGAYAGAVQRAARHGQGRGK